MVSVLTNAEIQLVASTWVEEPYLHRVGDSLKISPGSIEFGRRLVAMEIRGVRFEVYPEDLKRAADAMWAAVGPLGSPNAR